MPAVSSCGRGGRAWRPALVPTPPRPRLLVLRLPALAAALSPSRHLPAGRLGAAPSAPAVALPRSCPQGSCSGRALWVAQACVGGELSVRGRPGVPQRTPEGQDRTAAKQRHTLPCAQDGRRPHMRPEHGAGSHSSVRGPGWRLPWGTGARGRGPDPSTAPASPGSAGPPVVAVTAALPQTPPSRSRQQHRALAASPRGVCARVRRIQTRSRHSRLLLAQETRRDSRTCVPC